MGGVGKTMLTAAVIRDNRVRAVFELIGWISMSQQPDILRLQQRLYQQFTGEESMPGKLSTSIELQAGVLKKAAVGKVVLVVLDGKLHFLSWRNYA